MAPPPVIRPAPETVRRAAGGPRSARRAILDDIRSGLHHLAAEFEGRAPNRHDADPIVHRLRALQADLDLLIRSAEDDRELLAHALRTPLNAIAGWIGVLREHAENPATVHQAADVLDRSVSALTRIVDASTR
jgi:signal transduction histidine kinase